MNISKHLIKLTCWVLTLSLICSFLVINQKPAYALPEAKIPVGYKINNSGLGFSYYLPDGWGELSPILMEIYNVATKTLSQGAEPPYLVATYSNTGSKFIPPILMLHYIEQPITASMIQSHNDLFMDEAKDMVGKTKLAQELGLATELRFIEAKYLRTGAPLATAEADSSFGFTIKIMTTPYYFNHGILILTYFAPKDDFPLFENEILELFHSLSIDPNHLPN